MPPLQTMRFHAHRFLSESRQIKTPHQRNSAAAAMFWCRLLQRASSYPKFKLTFQEGTKARPQVITYSSLPWAQYLFILGLLTALLGLLYNSGKMIT